MAHHPILTWRSCAVLAVATGYFYYLNRAYTGPWAPKWDLPAKAKEKTRDLPEFASLFSIDSHPALKKNQPQ